MTESKPSKSEQKREQLALQSLGEQLIELPQQLLDGLNIGERLQTAIDDIRRMKSHEARRRQKQYIGKLMREVDPAPIRELLDRLRADDRREKRLFAHAERWRDRLIRDPHDALAEFRADFPQASPALAALLATLGSARSDAEERRIKRQIFREVHAVLVSRAADG